METIVDRIRVLCVKNKTSITKIEVELGYANGTIGKWAKGKRRPPLEKVTAIAARLNTTPEYLYEGDVRDTENPSAQEAGGELPHAKYRELLSEGGIRVLLDTDAKVPQENLEDIIKYIKLRQRDVGR